MDYIEIMETFIREKNLNSILNFFFFHIVIYNHGRRSTAIKASVTIKSSC